MTLRNPKLVLALFLLLVVLVVAMEPAFAQDIDFSKADKVGNTFLAWMQGNLATIAFTIGFVVLGFLAAFNRISWFWLFGLILGAMLVFGADGFVKALKGILS